MCDTDDITSIKLVSISGAETGYTGSALHPLHNSSIGFFWFRFYACLKTKKIKHLLKSTYSIQLKPQMIVNVLEQLISKA